MFNAICSVIGLNNMIGQIIFAILLAYGSSICVQSVWFETLLGLLKIRSTPNECIWRDIIKVNQHNYVKVYDDDGFYVGGCSLYESEEREPIIVLQYYERRALDGTLISEADLVGNRRMVLNLKDFKKLEVVYKNPSEVS